MADGKAVSLVQFGLSGEDEGLDGVDQGGRPARPGADLPEDLPALELRVCAFAGAASRAWAVLTSFFAADRGR